MSNERLSGKPHSSGFDSFIIARRIKSIFPKGKMFLMIREQKTFLQSNYFQYLSYGGTFGLDKYLTLKYDGRRPGFSPNHIEYHHMISDYYSLLGKKNVLVLPYELFNLDKAAFFGLLSQFLGSRISLSNLDFSVLYNQKSGHFINHKLRFMNIFLKSNSVNNNSPLVNSYSKKFVTFILTLSQKIIPNRLNEKVQTTISKKLENWVGNQFVASNKRVASLISIDVSDYGYY